MKKADTNSGYNALRVAKHLRRRNRREGALLRREGNLTAYKAGNFAPFEELTDDQKAAKIQRAESDIADLKAKEI